MITRAIVALSSSSWVTVAAPLANHLWQSTLFAGVAGLLTLILRRNQAQARYWLWLTTSAKFLVPFSLLAGIGSHLTWVQAPAIRRPGFAVTVQQIGQPFGLAEPSSTVAPASTALAMRLLESLLLAVWICGCAAVLLFWWLRWRRMTTVIRGAVPVQSGRELDVLRRLERSGGIDRVELIVSETVLEPGIVGVIRPVMLLPAGISDRLTDEQLEAIITHELCHVRRRDNLAAAIHMFVEAIFWFHPLAWWIGARLVDERERACDEEVLRLGNEAQAYAQGILKVCEFYLKSPLVCVAGVTGSNLKKRIEAIMIHRVVHELDLRRKVLLAVMGVLALIGPVVIGLMNPAPTQAQAQFGSAVVPAFESASIKPNRSVEDPSKPRPRLIKITDDNVEITNLPLKELVKYAYDLDDSQISGGADWVNSERYDITVRKTQSANEAMTKLQFQKLLAERFGLAVHREIRNLPVLELVVGKAGLKVNAAQPPNPAAPENRIFFRLPSHVEAKQSTMQELSGTLAMPTRHLVLDRTGLKGVYDFRLDWAENSSDAVASISTALSEQLGLELNSKTEPVETLVIDHAEEITGD